MQAKTRKQISSLIVAMVITTQNQLYAFENDVSEKYYYLLEEGYTCESGVQLNEKPEVIKSWKDRIIVSQGEIILSGDRCQDENIYLKANEVKISEDQTRIEFEGKTFKLLSYPPFLDF